MPRSYEQEQRRLARVRREPRRPRRRQDLDAVAARGRGGTIADLQPIRGARVSRDLARVAGGPSSTSRRKSTAQRKQRERERLRQQVQRERRKVKRGRGVRADTGSVTRGSRVTPKEEMRAALAALAQQPGLRPLPRRPPRLTERASAALPLHLQAVRVPINLARAFVEAPGSTAKGTAHGLRDALLGIPGGIVSAVTDPAGTVEEVAKDYARRYGPLLRPGGDREFIERIKREGAAGELLDATIVVSGPGAAAGRAASSTAATGALGRTAQRAVTKPRRRMRTSGGESRAQQTAPALGRAMREKRRDEAAYRGQQRAAERADSRRKGRAAKGPLPVEVREALEAGEVVPSRLTGVRLYTTDRGRHAIELSRAPSPRKLAKAQRRSYATAKGRALHAQRREQRAEVGAAKRNLASLNRYERAAFKDALQLGATSAKAARVLVARRLALIERERAKNTSNVLDTDEVPVLRALLAAPEQHFTDKLARVVREERERGRRVAAGDPGVATTQETLRRTKPQAEALDVTRAGTPIREAQAQARAATRTAKAARARAGRQVELRERRAARERGRAEILVGRSQRVTAKQVAALERAAILHEKAAANHARRAQAARSSETRAAHTERARAAAERGKAARELAKAARGAGGTKPTQTLRRLERSYAALLEAERARETARARVGEAKAAERDLSARRRRGQELVDAEPVEAFVLRTSEAAKAAGAESPGYFPSRKRERVRYSEFAVGGSRAVQPDRRYTGKLFREGREDASETTYLQGAARSIKRKHNWNLIADTFDAHTVPWGRDKTIAQLEDELVRRGVDPDSVAFWNPGRYRHARSEWERADGSFDEPSGGEEPVAAGVGEAVRQSTVDGRALATVPEAFRSTRGWSIVPKALYDEVHADTRPSGALARSLDVVKGKQARIMLGLSPAWLQFQVASNGLLAGLAGTGPVDLLKANLVWWRRLSDEQKAAVEPYVGIGPFADSYEQTRLGAASNAAIVNAYRAFKAHEFWHKPRAGGKSIRDLNPLDVLFRIDNAQNNAFRRAVLYSQVKRDAYKRMGGRMRAIQRDQEGLMRMLTLGPEDAMLAVLRDPAALERHARHVNAFLGNYMTYTVKERRWLQRNVIFYGFLRHSLKLAFHTLPARHPLVASLVGQLGRMQTREVRRLLGGDELPYALGRFYFTKGDQLKSVDLSRANPALNTVTSLSLRGPSSLVSLAPPLFVALANQAYSKSSFRQRAFRVRGENQGRKDSEYGVEDRLRIFLEEMLSLAAPYRTVKKATSTGPEGDDSSLLLGRRPTQYKRPDIVAAIRRDEQRRPDSPAERVLLELTPLVPRYDNAPELAASIRQREGQPRGSGGAGGAPSREQLLVQRAARVGGGISAREQTLAQRAARVAASQR